jgi:hypothetical protein
MPSGQYALSDIQAQPPLPVKKGEYSVSDIDAGDAPNSTIAPVEPSVSDFLTRQLPSSAEQFAANFKNALLHPMDTMKALVDLGGSALTFGGSLNALEGNNETVNATKEYLAQRYGSLEKARHTAYTDPVGFVNDLASVAGPAADIADIEAPAAVSKITNAKIPVLPKLSSTLDPAEAEAVAYGIREGIPLDTATQTGSPAARNVQGFVQNQIGGARAAKRARMAQTKALTAKGEQIAGEVSPLPATPESAGISVQQALQTRKAQQASDASASYARLEEIENDPKSLQQVTTGTKTVDTGIADPQNPGKNIVRTQPVTKNMPLPVDMRPVKQALQPLYDQLKQQMPIAQQQSSQALKALDNILHGDDYSPASVAEANLSALKAIKREAVNDKTKFYASRAITEAGKAVDGAVAQAGPEAVDALNQGRKLTAAKYATQATIDSLQTEPVKLFNQLTAQKDTAINLLRDVQSKAPDAMPALGRAYLEGLLDTALAPGGIDKAGTALTQWRKLGDATKKALFTTPTQVKDLDNFFLLAKKLAENPNPSGTAYVASVAPTVGLMIKAPHLGIPYVISHAALAKLLFSPAGTRALMQGLEIPAGKGAAATLAANQILKYAGADAKPLNDQ